jgi:hypothetical protein
MKITIRATFALLLIAFCWAFFTSGIHPQFHDFSDVKKIQIEIYPRNEINWPHKSYQKEIEENPDRAYFAKTLHTQKEVEEFDELLGVTWDGYFPLHSYETGTTTCYISIYRNDGSRDWLSLSEYEWGNAGEPPERVWRFIRQTMSEPVAGGNG